jgi:DNA-binding response OmpR family regulator
MGNALKLRFSGFRDPRESGLDSPDWGANVQFLFADHMLDTDRRELHRGSESIAVEPQVLDLLIYLVQNRDRVVSKNDLIAQSGAAGSYQMRPDQPHLRRAEGGRRQRQGAS